MTKRSILRRVQLSAVALGAAAIAGGVAISGCGASNAIDPVAKAADRSSSTPGFRMSMTIQVSSGALPAPMTATGTGSFDPPAHSGRFSMTMALPGSAAVRQVFGSGGLHLEEVLKGSTVYVKLPAALSGRIPGAAKRPWMKVDLSKLPGGQGSALSSLTSNPVSGDPSQLLQYLRGSGGMTKVGTEQVTGRSTTHYRGHVSLDQVAGRVPAASRAALKRAIALLKSEGFANQLPVEVWVDTQGFVRQMQMRMSASPNGQSVAALIRVTIPQYGPQPAPAVPPASQVINPSGALGGF
jgi:hypothetical protein